VETNGGAVTEEPMFRIVRGAPTPDELAAIVGVLWSRRQAAAAAAANSAPAPLPSRWRASAAPRPGRLTRPGPGAWSSTHWRTREVSGPPRDRDRNHGVRGKVRTGGPEHGAGMAL